VGAAARREGHFDGIVAGLEPDAAAREEILANPVYRELSSASRLA